MFVFFFYCVCFQSLLVNAVPQLSCVYSVSCCLFSCNWCVPGWWLNAVSLQSPKIFYPQVNCRLPGCANTPNNALEMRGSSTWNFKRNMNFLINAQEKGLSWFFSPGLPFATLCGTTPSQRVTFENTQWRKGLCGTRPTQKVEWKRINRLITIFVI